MLTFYLRLCCKEMENHSARYAFSKCVEKPRGCHRVKSGSEIPRSLFTAMRFVRTIGKSQGDIYGRVLCKTDLLCGV